MFPTPLVGLALLVACSSPLPPPSTKVDQTKTLYTTPVNSSVIVKHYPRCVPYLERIRQEANRIEVSPNLFLGLIIYESGCNTHAVSSAGAVGLGQVMPDKAIKGRPSATALTDPNTNLAWSANILRGTISRWKSLDYGIASYYGGVIVSNGKVVMTEGGKRYLNMVRTMEKRVQSWRVYP